MKAQKSFPACFEMNFKATFTLYTYLQRVRGSTYIVSQIDLGESIRHHRHLL